MLTIEEVREKAKGQWFSVEFIKKDGTLRQMNCRMGVKKYLQGGELKYAPDERNLLVVWDKDKADYRMINFNTIKKIKIGGNTWAQ